MTHKATIQATALIGKLTALAFGTTLWVAVVTARKQEAINRVC